MGPLMTLIAGLAAGAFHAGSCAAGRLAATIATTDARVALEAQRLRQSVLFAHANMPGLDRDVRAAELAEAAAMGRAGASAPCAPIWNIREGAAMSNAAPARSNWPKRRWNSPSC
jgi:hypothetical protein